MLVIFLREGSLKEPMAGGGAKGLGLKSIMVELNPFHFSQTNKF
jgi:hypothetical protein